MPTFLKKQMVIILLLFIIISDSHSIISANDYIMSVVVIRVQSCDEEARGLIIKMYKVP